MFERLRKWLFKPIAPEQPQPDPVDPYLLALLAGGYVDADALLADIEDHDANFFMQEDMLDGDE